MCGVCTDRNQIYDQHRNLTFHEAIARFKRRYDVADRDGDGLLNKEEFTDFLMPCKSTSKLLDQGMMILGGCGGGL